MGLTRLGMRSNYQCNRLTPHYIEYLLELYGVTIGLALERHLQHEQLFGMQG